MKITYEYSTFKDLGSNFYIKHYYLDGKPWKHEIYRREALHSKRNYYHTPRRSRSSKESSIYRV